MSNKVPNDPFDSYSGNNDNYLFVNSNPVVYPVVQEYSNTEQLEDIETHDGSISISPGWCMAVVRLNKPLSYSRRYKRSVGEIASGAFQRREEPLIIFDDCIQLSINRTLGSHLKNLSAVLKGVSNNYLSANAILPGDWIFAWCHNNIGDTERIVNQIKENKPCNDFNDGLKFVGRVFSIRKNVSVTNRAKTAIYYMKAFGFGEFDTEFFYDVHLFNNAALGGTQTLPLFLKTIGLNWTEFISSELYQQGQVTDNMDKLIPALVDAVIGKGISYTLGNKPLKEYYDKELGANKGIDNNQVSQNGARARTLAISEDVPYSYMVPVSVAQLLGKTVVDKSKSTVFGYADILHLLIGVQQYDNESNNTPSKGFWPTLREDSTPSRSFCTEKVKGTYLPTNAGTIINRPLWQLLQQFLNPAINKMYTALKVGPEGKIIPTLVVRQIPFSSNSIPEPPGIKLTRFLDLPRWKIDPVMVKNLDIGRSDGTHFNMVKLTPDFPSFDKTDIINAAKLNLRYPPIYDDIDIGRSGIRSYVQTINCDIKDAARSNGFRTWAEMVADWTIGSQFTLNGTLQCTGIQTPISEGDNLEFEGVVYHIESITDTCSMVGGSKVFNTTITLNNGMPVDQGDMLQDFPRYPGFSIEENTQKTDVETTQKQRKTEFELTRKADQSIENTMPDGLFNDLSTPQFIEAKPTETDALVGDDSILTNVDPGMTEER